jgi:hypothetical protein
MRLAPRLRVASEDKSFMVILLRRLHATEKLARENELPLLSDDQSDDR